jgi:hypothetical protein
MSKGDEEGGGGRRAEWIDGANKGAAWIWWRRPEEWAGVIAEWVCIFMFIVGVGLLVGVRGADEVAG